MRKTTPLPCEQGRRLVWFSESRGRIQCAQEQHYMTATMDPRMISKIGPARLRVIDRMRLG